MGFEIRSYNSDLLRNCWVYDKMYERFYLAPCFQAFFISATHGIQLGVSIEPEEDLKSAINIKSLERKNAEMPLCIL